MSTKTLAKAALAALAAALFSVLAVVPSFAATQPPTHHHFRPIVLPTTKCEYWTTDEAVSAIVVTQGVANCSVSHPFTIWVAPYRGATFPSFNAYLQQIGEYVFGPSLTHGPSVKGLPEIASLKNVFTNGEPTQVYRGLGDRYDGAAEVLKALLAYGCPYGAGECT